VYSFQVFGLRVIKCASVVELYLSLFDLLGARGDWVLLKCECWFFILVILCNRTSLGERLGHMILTKFIPV